jgi:hypothetical protein
LTDDFPATLSSERTYRLPQLVQETFTEVEPALRR